MTEDNDNGTPLVSKDEAHLILNSNVTKLMADYSIFVFWYSRDIVIPMLVTDIFSNIAAIKELVRRIKSSSSQPLPNDDGHLDRKDMADESRFSLVNSIVSEVKAGLNKLIENNDYWQSIKKELENNSQSN